MDTQLRKMGIDVVGDMPWGTHFCHLYETKENLLDTLVPYFKAGLEENEFCVWVISEPLTEEEASAALRQVIPNLDQYLSGQSIEIFVGPDWYLKEGLFDLNRVISVWNEKLDKALSRGYDGMRVSGDAFWLQEKDRKEFCEYENQLNESITDKLMTVLCAYPLANSDAAEILDEARNHQFALARRGGEWDIVETSGLKQSKAEIKRQNEELEQQVIERTEQLTAVNEELKKKITERKRDEEQLAYHAYLLENVHDAVIATDERLDVTAWNKGAERMYGWRTDEVLGRNIWEVVPIEMSKEQRAEALRELEQRGQFRTEAITYRKDGTPVCVEGITIALRGEEEGQITGYVNIRRDITQRKQAEEQLLAIKDELATELIAMTSLHEFSTPLLENTELQSILEEVLNATIALQNADFGTVQLYNPETRALEIVAQLGFQKDFLDYFESVHEDSAICGRALKRRERVIIEDVQTDAGFEPHLPIAVATGYRAVQSTPLFSRNGEPLGMISTYFREPHRPSDRNLRLTDLYARQAAEMIERKRAEEILRESEQKFSLIYDKAPFAIALSKLSEGVIVNINEAWTEIFGFTEEEAAGKTSLELGINRDPAGRALFLDEIQKQGSIRNYEQPFFTKSGKVRLLACSTDVVAFGGERYLLSTMHDITEHKQAEEALKASNEKLQTLNEDKQASNEELQFLNEKLQVTAEELESRKDELLDLNNELEKKVAEVSLANSDLRNFMDSTKIGTIFLDRGLRIKRYTPQIEKLFNILPSDIDRPLEHFTHRLNHLNLQEDARQVLADLKNVEREILSKDGHWYIVRLLPYRTQEDKIDGVVVTFVEITERKRTEEALQKAQAELAHVSRVTTLGEFTASIAHEVNQPLGAIVINGQACLRLLARDSVDLNEAREAVECTINDALRASEVIKRIRALLKKHAPEKSLLDINETIQEVIRMVSSELVKNQILLRTELEKNLPPVLGDRIQLQQVALNLILNAKEAMSSKGWKPRELLISSEKSEVDKAMVTVRDSGKGFDPKISERLFDAFFTTKKKAGGLGLGLSISRTIIEAHGGRLWSAPNEGKGATFRFTIPTSDENHL